MKIILLVSSLGSGGAERVATTLCNAWAGRGDRVTLIPTFSGGGAPFYDVDSSVELVYLASQVRGHRFGGKNYLVRLRALRNMIVARRPDVVISFLPNVNIAALAATAFSGIPCIACERSDPTVQPLGRGWRMACKLFYRTADLVTVQTRAVAESIGKVYGGLRQVAVVPNPLPEGVLAVQRKLAETPRQVLVSLGRLAEEKQVDLIIDTFAKLAPGYPTWDLHVHGDGPLKAQLAEQIENTGLGQRIRLMGRTDAPWETMAAADAFVAASSYEGFPNALLEAMGTGLPCVATDCPSGPREISRDGADALLVPAGNPAALESALARIMGDAALRKDLGSRARKSVMDRYSLPAVLKTWDAIFATLGVVR